MNRSDIERLEIEEIQVVQEVSDLKKSLKEAQGNFWTQRKALRSLKRSEKRLQEIRLTLRLETKDTPYEYNKNLRDRYFSSFMTNILNINRKEGKDPYKDFLRAKNNECYQIGIELFGKERMDQVEEGIDLTQEELRRFSVAFKESFSTGRLKQIQDEYLSKYPGMFIPNTESITS